ncbi:hypothetical protein ILUMI_07096 [Ignelater luminosus]|uniref:Reverse transcriptase domain-containing protein n=1 Tax=Ignelater luminosus TaxID=2038154 RepID=A0A8K0D4I3_IGNLU|nr:hypothetical protein ILUMI_07096 [Ignelater luminosus]
MLKQLLKTTETTTTSTGPLLTHEIMKKVLEDIDEGILINSERLNNIRYVDNTVLLADTLQGLQALVSWSAETSHTYGLDFNIKRNKYMVIVKHHILPDQLESIEYNTLKVSQANEWRGKAATQELKNKMCSKNTDNPYAETSRKDIRLLVNVKMIKVAIEIQTVCEKASIPTQKQKKQIDLQSGGGMRIWQKKRNQQHKVAKTQQEQQKGENEDLIEDINLEELKEAISKVKEGKESGVDGIEPEMIKLLEERGRKYLLEIIQEAKLSNKPQPDLASKTNFFSSARIARDDKLDERELTLATGREFSEWESYAGPIN